MMDADDITLTFQRTKDEVIESHYQYLQVRKIFRMRDNIIDVAFLVFSVMLIIIASFRLVTIIILIIGLAIKFSRRFVYSWYPLYKIKRGMSNFLQENEIILSSDGIWESAKPESKKGWNHISAIWEGNDYFFVNTKENELFNIPKRAFSDLKDVQTFREILATNSIHINS